MGIDIHLFIPFVHSITGRKPIFIKPSDLRLCPCHSSLTGFTLHHAVGVDTHGNEVLEPIHQIGLELHQHELRGLPAPMLRGISLHYFNDLRTVFLVHDKRMLGIVLQELGNLVSVQGALTFADAETLRQGIALTINPDSDALTALAKLSNVWPALKDDFLLKPIRYGKGAGIVFGCDLTPQEWSARLHQLRKPQLKEDKVKFVVQRRIQQPHFSILLHNKEDIQRNYLVGTYMAVHGRYLGIATWRTSSSAICAISHGGAWINSVLPAEETGM